MRWMYFSIGRPLKISASAPIFPPIKSLRHLGFSGKTSGVCRLMTMSIAPGIFGYLPLVFNSNSSSLPRCGADRLFVRLSLRCESFANKQHSFRSWAVEYQIGSVPCLVSFFDDECFWRKKFEHRIGFLAAPMVIEGNCRNT